MRVPQEVWDKISRDLPSISVGYAAKIFRFQLWPQQSRHCEVWSSVFREPSWLFQAVKYGLNPVLLGCNLGTVASRCHSGGQYLVLLLEDSDLPSPLGWQFPGSSRCKDMLNKSLRPHRMSQQVMEVEFGDGTILNIANAYEDCKYIPVSIQRLLSKDGPSHRTHYVCFNDGDFAIRALRPNAAGVHRLERHFLRKSDLSWDTFRLYLEFPDRRRVQYSLKDLDCENFDEDILGHCQCVLIA